METLTTVQIQEEYDSAAQAAKKKGTCHNCRKTKRKCDRGLPCSGCSRKNVPCEYNCTDRRLQRVPFRYIRLLEANNEVLEATLNELVGLKDLPEELVRKLQELHLPKTVQRPEDESGLPVQSPEPGADLRPEAPDNTNEPIITGTAQYFGPGSCYHQTEVLGIGQEPLLLTHGESLAVLLEQNYDAVVAVVHAFFQQPWLTLHTLFDRDLVLGLLEARELNGPYLNKALVYAICANCERLTHAQAVSYCELSLRDLFIGYSTLTVAVSQCYSLLAVHCVSRGQVSKAWLFAGIAMRVGMDIGFDMYLAKNTSPAVNRCFMATMIIDAYFSISVGRRTTLQQNHVPVFRLPNELDVEYLNMKYAVDLLNLSRPMTLATYQPVKLDADPRINYLLKFNQSKTYNIRLQKWRQGLDPTVAWLKNLLRVSNPVKDCHTLKALYYYFLIFINKPFLHVPKEHSYVYLIEEMIGELAIIIERRLETMVDINGRPVPTSGPIYLMKHDDAQQNRSASMDICVIQLLINIMLTLITSQPEHYLYLENSFLLFIRYLSFINMRKYDAKEHLAAPLLDKYNAFRATYKPVSKTNSNAGLPASSLSTAPTEEESPTSKGNMYAAPAAQMEMPKAEVPHNSQSVAMEQPMVGNSLPSEDIHPAAHASRMPQWQEPPRMPHEFPTGQPMYPEQMPLAQGSGQPLQGQQLPMETQYHAVPGMPTEPMRYNPEMGGSEAVYYTYDQLPKTGNPVDDMMNQLFSNSGEEYKFDRSQFNWDGLFQEQYPVAGQDWYN